MTKVRIEDFCRDYYDSQIFHPIIAGVSNGLVNWWTVFKSIRDVDESFAIVDFNLFVREMTALRIELFGLAWMHRLKKDKYVLPEIVFTKQYLERRGKSATWRIMGEYNQIIAGSSIELANIERMPKGWIDFIGDLRVELYEKWVNDGVDKQCAARVSNRTATDIAWSEGITLQKLAVSLANRLGCDIILNAEALFRLSAVISRLYHEAKEHIRAVKISTG